MIEIVIPTSQDEISLGRYQKFAKLSGDDDFIARKMLQIFCGVDDVFKVSVSDIYSVSKIISKALSEEQNELIKTFSLEGIRMGFIPNLSKMSYGEFIDLERYISDWDTMHKAMSILYRPVTKDSGGLYKIQAYKGTDDAEKYKKMPISVVFSSIVFFYRIVRKISNHYLKELEEVKSQMSTQQEDSLQRDGVGMLRLMNSLMETLQDTKMSLLYPSRLVLPLSHINQKSNE
jgi:hypothetical protein